MTTVQNHTSQTIHSGSLTKRMIQGAIIGLVLISAFLISTGSGKPEWGNWWMIKPLLMQPFAGAVGGAVYYYFDEIRFKGGWNRIIADILSLVIFIVGMWMGSVLGLNGTYWN
ncbi:MAG: potassium transporter KefB [Bacteroidota bacterium]